MGDFIYISWVLIRTPTLHPFPSQDNLHLEEKDSRITYGRWLLHPPETAATEGAGHPQTDLIGAGGAPGPITGWGGVRQTASGPESAF